MDTQQKEPIWRQILNWGCVGYFLGLPAMAIVLGFSHYGFGATTPNVPKFLTEFHFAVSALVATMAGLNSFERYKTNGQKKVIEYGDKN